MKTVKEIMKGRDLTNSVVVFKKGEQYGKIMSGADAIKDYGDCEVKKYWFEQALCIMLK